MPSPSEIKKGFFYVWFIFMQLIATPVNVIYTETFIKGNLHAAKMK